MISWSRSNIVSYAPSMDTLYTFQAERFGGAHPRLSEGCRRSHRDYYVLVPNIHPTDEQAPWISSIGFAFDACYTKPAEMVYISHHHRYIQQKIVTSTISRAPIKQAQQNLNLPYKK